MIEAKVTPIKNSVTGDAHRARVSLPHGFEFNEAELASGTFTATGDLTLDYKERSAIFADFAFGPSGIVQ